MDNKSTQLHVPHVTSRRAFLPCSEDDVAASVREAFGASIASILALLKERGVHQKDIAKALGLYPPQVSRWRDGVIPKPEVLDQFIAFANKHLFESEHLEPDDLFRGQQLTRMRRENT